MLLQSSAWRQVTTDAEAEPSDHRTSGYLGRVGKGVLNVRGKLKPVIGSLRSGYEISDKFWGRLDIDDGTLTFYDKLWY
jgi:hypothetical protein